MPDKAPRQNVGSRRARRSSARGTAAKRHPASDRLDRLLTVSLAIYAEHTLAGVLRQVVDAARELLGARYAAIGVLSPDGGSLSDFVTSGLDAAAIKRIGERPTGQGLLGLLIRDPKPLRVADLSKHSWHVNLPRNHPPMKSFLGVPVMARGKVFGNLYLTEKTGAPAFDAEDERVATALAAQVGGAIESAQLMEQLEASHQARDRFHAMMNHELRNAITGVYGWLDILRRRERDDARPALKEAWEAAGHSAQLLDDLLDLSRLDAGAFKVAPHPLVPEKVVAEAMSAVAPLATSARVRLIREDGHNITTPAFSDGLRLRQVLINLLRNAVQQSPAGEAVRIVVDGDPNQVTFTVIDRGPGLDGARHARLFEPYERETESYSGAGLGLMLSRRLAQLLDGDLTVHSQKGQGATFTLRVTRTMKVRA